MCTVTLNLHSSWLLGYSRHISTPHLHLPTCYHLHLPAWNHLHLPAYHHVHLSACHYVHLPVYHHDCIPNNLPSSTPKSWPSSIPASLPSSTPSACQLAITYTCQLAIIYTYKAPDTWIPPYCIYFRGMQNGPRGIVMHQKPYLYSFTPENVVNTAHGVISCVLSFTYTIIFPPQKVSFHHIITAQHGTVGSLTETERLARRHFHVHFICKTIIWESNNIADEIHMNVSFAHSMLPFCWRGI